MNLRLQELSCLKLISGSFAEKDITCGHSFMILEKHLDEVLKDETLLPRLQAAKTPEEAKTIVKSAAGLKINLDPAITIEFTPKE